MQQVEGHGILLGGIGGDSHSVGLNILRQGLLLNGFRVMYMGIQNRIEDFFDFSSVANAVLISNMDGHARHYLRGFPELFRHRPNPAALWYIGGNLTIGDAIGHERQFLDMGFHRAFVKFADIETVLQVLKNDLGGKAFAQDHFGLWERRHTTLFDHCPANDESAIDIDTFDALRAEVLDHWRTGKSAKNVAETAEYLARQPSFPLVQGRVNSSLEKILIQPRSGVATVEAQIRLFQAFKNVGARVLSYQVDSLTRNNNYSGVEEMLREARHSGEHGLNGFPVVNHGVEGLRRVMAEVGIPLQTRHSTRDPRLLAEISLAGGVTAFEGGAICYNIPYYRDYPISEAITNWQYVDRLVGVYFEDFGIKIDREFFGTLTATLIPPSLAIVINLIQSILAVQQGVKCLSVGYAEQGHRPQDIAAIACLKEIIPETLIRMGYLDVQVNAIFHQYMAAFPSVPIQAENLIINSAATAQLARATRILTKTPVEAIKIPTLSDNVHGISLAMRGVEEAAEQSFDINAVSREKSIIRKEVDAIMGKVFELGKGRLIPGVIKAFQDGAIDIPFSPSLYNRGEVMTARDSEGAVRFINTGALPFDRDIREFHRSRMGDRRRHDSCKDDRHDYLLVERDVMMIARGQFEEWPLHR